MRFIWLQNLWLIGRKMGLFSPFDHVLSPVLAVHLGLVYLEKHSYKLQIGEVGSQHRSTEVQETQYLTRSEFRSTSLIFEDFFFPHFQQIKSNLWFSLLLLKSSKNERRHAGLTLRYLSCAVTLLSPLLSHPPRFAILLHGPMCFSLW